MYRSTRRPYTALSCDLCISVSQLRISELKVTLRQRRRDTVLDRARSTSSCTARAALASARPRPLALYTLRPACRAARTARAQQKELGAVCDAVDAREESRALRAK